MERKVAVRKRQEPSSSHIGQIKKPRRSNKKTWLSLWLCPAILEQIFKGTDFERLKTYRLVCKEWNTEICRLIPSTTWPSTDFFGFVKLLESGKELGLPTPFKNIHVSLPCSGLLSLIIQAPRLQAHIPITKLTLGELNNSGSTETPEHVLNLLMLCAGSLIFFKTQFIDKERHCPNVQFQLPNLKCLELTSVRVNVLTQARVTRLKESQFFGPIISASPSLKQLKMEDIVSCSELLKTENLQAIEELELMSNALSGDRNDRIWRALKDVRIDNLKKLTLNLIGTTDQCHAVVCRFSDTLEDLKIGKSGLATLPVCPKLTHVEFVSCSAVALSSIASPALQYRKINEFVAAKGPFAIPPKFENQISYIYCSKDTLPMLLQRFSDATSWAVPYTYLPTFIQVAVENSLKVEQLQVSTSGFQPRSSMRKAQDALVADRKTFSTLPLLTDLKELQLHHEKWMSRNVNIDVRTIDFKAMPNLKTLCHVGAGLRGYLSVKEHLKGLDSVVIVFTHVVVTPSKDKKDVLKFLSRLPNFTFIF